jgi:ureidoglycolate lyase
MRTLQIEPLTKEAFAPFGDVIETDGSAHFMINNGSSQAFIPLLGNPFLIVVAPVGDAPQSELVRVFRSNGRQGVNYHRGVWHHPVLTIEKRDDFLVVDRSGSGNNCDEHFFNEDEQLLLTHQ